MQSRDTYLLAEHSVDILHHSFRVLDSVVSCINWNTHKLFLRLFLIPTGKKNVDLLSDFSSFRTLVNILKRFLGKTPSFYRFCFTCGIHHVANTILTCYHSISRYIRCLSGENFQGTFLAQFKFRVLVQLGLLLSDFINMVIAWGKYEHLSCRNSIGSTFNASLLTDVE